MSLTALTFRPEQDKHHLLGEMRVSWKDRELSGNSQKDKTARKLIKICFYGEAMQQNFTPW